MTCILHVQVSRRLQAGRREIALFAAEFREMKCSEDSPAPIVINKNSVQGADMTMNAGKDRNRETSLLLFL